MPERKSTTARKADEAEEPRPPIFALPMNVGDHQAGETFTAEQAEEAGIDPAGLTPVTQPAD